MIERSHRCIARNNLLPIYRRSSGFRSGAIPRYDGYTSAVSVAIGSERNDRERGGEREKMKRSTIQRGTSDRIVALTRRFSIGQFGRATREQTHGKRGDRDPSGTRGTGRGRLGSGGIGLFVASFRCLVTIRYDDEPGHVNSW